MANFTRTLFCAGFGGQGVMVLGQLVAYAELKRDDSQRGCPLTVRRCAAAPQTAV